MRWHHPKRGMISPAEFIPLAEETEAIVAMGEWALRTACRDAAGGKIPGTVAVNLSPVQFGRDDLAETIHAILLETGLSPRRLEVEVTESTIMSDQTRGLHILRKLKAMGISVAMDDFGTGYSSLATLHAFPFDKIKLDQSFVRRLPDDAAAAAIVRTVLALGASLGMPVLAEGIETEAQWQFLDREGCAKGQGYLFARPVSLGATAGCNRRRGALCSRRATGRSNRPRDSGGIARNALGPTHRSQQPILSECARACYAARVFRRRFYQRDRRMGMADDKKKRGGADRALIALSEAYEVAYWSKKFKITPAKLKTAVKKAGRSAKNVEAYLKLQKHKAADRARIALSQPYEVSYWSKKFKVTPARLKAAVAAVGHSSKKVGAYLTGSKKKSAKKASKKTAKKAVKKTAKKRAKKKAA